MDLDLSKTSLWISIFIGAILAAAASAGFQKYGSDEESSEINIKGVVRDAILGGIFVAMAWTFVPDSMTTITETVTSTVTSATVATASKISKGTEVDVQVGPASF
jgi:hypothetical protein